MDGGRILESKECSPSYMSSIERNAFREFFMEHFAEINVVTLIKSLHDNIYIDEYFQRKVSNAHEMYTLTTLVFYEISNMCKYEHVIEALTYSGQKEMALKLLKLLQRMHQTSVQAGVKKIEDARNKSIHRYFRNVKRIVHDGKLPDIRGFLRKVAKNLETKMLSETNPNKRQHLADKYIAHLGAEIDALAITFDTNLPDHDIFEELSSLTGKGTNTLISEVVYFGRKANAHAIAGQFSDGENMVKQAHCCANFSVPCLEIANMIYIDVYFKLWQFEKNPTAELRKSLMYEGSKGLWALSEEEEGIRALWKRMFLLRMIFCLLGIGNRANVIENYTVSKTCMAEAAELLTKIDLNGIETRREMFYWVAHARLSELRSDISGSVKSIKTAVELAKKGNFKERNFICEYEIKLTEYDRVHESNSSANDVKALDSCDLNDYVPNLKDSLPLEPIKQFAVENNTHQNENECADSMPESLTWSALGSDSYEFDLKPDQSFNSDFTEIKTTECDEYFILYSQQNVSEKLSNQDTGESNVNLNSEKIERNGFEPNKIEPVTLQSVDSLRLSSFENDNSDKTGKI